MTNLTFVASLAYKAIAVQLALSEANYASQRLNLPTPHPIQMTDLVKAYAGSPKLRPPHGVAIETTNFYFSIYINKKGPMHVIINKARNIESLDLDPVRARTPSLIDSNGAYQLATQWLASIDVDVAALEKKYGSQRKIEQAFFWNQPSLDVDHHPPGDTNKTTLPVFNVTWGHGQQDEYAVQARILGTTKELMSLTLGDSTLSRRPPLLITNAMELNNTEPPVKHLERPSPLEPVPVLPTNPPSAQSK